MARHLAAGEVVTFGPSFVPDGAINAIATTTTATTVLASEVT